MKRRAEQVDETRQRITEAATRLHTTIGPANTSIAAIADEAGVTRLTVYRHFPTLDELFVACRGHWRETHDPLDPRMWPLIAGFEERARRALGELYTWYEANTEDLYPTNRDFDAMPASTQDALRREHAGLVDRLVAGADSGPTARRLRAIVGHLVSYWTWRSLVVDEGLSNEEAIELGVEIILAGSTSHPT